MRLRRINLGAVPSWRSATSKRAACEVLAPVEASTSMKSPNAGSRSYAPATSAITVVSSTMRETVACVDAMPDRPVFHGERSVTLGSKLGTRLSEALAAVRHKLE